MPVTLRLARHGQKKRPFYRIVAADKQSWRDGRFLEVVGVYNTMTNPPEITLKEDKVRHWISAGAQTSTIVRSLIKKTIPGYIEALEKGRREKIQAARKKRKERAAAASKGSPAPKKSNTKTKTATAKGTEKKAKKS